jgi:hypothetical protein
VMTLTAGLPGLALLAVRDSRLVPDSKALAKQSA